MVILLVWGTGHSCVAAEGDKVRSIFSVPSDPVMAADLRDALQEIRQNAKSPARRIALVNELLRVNKTTLFREVTITKNHSADSLRTAIEVSAVPATRADGVTNSSQEAKASLQRDFLTALLETRLASVSHSKNSIASVNALLSDNKQVVAQAFKIQKPVRPSLDAMVAEIESTKSVQTDEGTKTVNLQVAAIRARFSGNTPKARIAAVNKFLKENTESFVDLRQKASNEEKEQPQTLTQ